MSNEISENETIRISVIEDDDQIRNMFIILLEGTPGFRCVSSYANAEDALADIPRKQPDIVLMDINLPGMNGIACTLELKKQLPELDIMMLTVYEDSDHIFDSLKAGAVGYLLKSTSPSDILEAVREAVRGGSPMSAQIARKVTQSFHQPVGKSPQLESLTDREQEILSLLASGYMYKEIADRLTVSIDTVKTHIRHIYDKLQVRTRTEAVVKYLGS